MALHCTMTYHGPIPDNGDPQPWFHYLVVAKPGPKAGTGSATIMSLSNARKEREAQGKSRVVSATSGGPEGALAEAERFLDAKHPGLSKIVSDPRNG